MSIAEESFRYSGLFEAELLLELMMRYWNHPHADNTIFRTNLLETAVEVLRLAIAGTSSVEGVKPEKMNLVAAIWCAEVLALDGVQEDSIATAELRKQWTEKVRRAVPSCFCDPDMLN